MSIARTARYRQRVTEESDLARNRASRWSIMLDRLATTGRLGVGEAAELLGVSEATIRRDFSELAKRQLVARNHGGVVATSVAYELPYRYRSSMADDDRTRVAEAAAALVQPGQVIGLNGGTTTTATSRAITAREDLAADGGITIVTNALNSAPEAVSQKLTELRVGKATSRMPSCSGTAKFMMPTTNGIAMKKIMIVPCAEKI